MVNRHVLGFPCGSAGKESTCKAGHLGSIPVLGRSPGEGKGFPLQYSGLENSMDCIVHGITKSRTQLSDRRSLHLFFLRLYLCLIITLSVHIFLPRLLFLGARLRPLRVLREAWVRAFTSQLCKPRSVEISDQKRVPCKPSKPVFPNHGMSGTTSISKKSWWQSSQLFILLKARKQSTTGHLSQFYKRKDFLTTAARHL